MSSQRNGCLHSEAKTLVTAEFFPAFLTLLFCVLLSVSLLKEGGEKHRETQEKIPDKIAYIIYYQYLKSEIKNASEKGGSSLAFKKKEKMKPQQ